MKKGSCSRTLTPGVPLLLGILILAGGLAPVAQAQLVRSFTKDDCNERNNPCQPPPPAPADDCDDVLPPDPAVNPDRTSPVGGIMRVQLRIENDGTIKSGLALRDLLPPCLQIDCVDPTMDTDCDTVPDSPPVHITSSPGVAWGGYTCDETSNSLTVQPIGMDAYAWMDIRFHATFTRSGLCCNDATLSDPTGASQTALDGLLLTQGLCVQVGPDVVFWKDDCGSRTGDPADCDEVVMVDADGDTIPETRDVFPSGPPNGQTVQWVLHFENNDTRDLQVRISDSTAGSHHVTCAPADDPSGAGWGCFEMLLDGNPLPLGFDDVCTPGLAGSVDVSELLFPGSTLEVRFCARLYQDPGDPQVCNDGAWAYVDGTRLSPYDLLDGDSLVCLGDGGSTPFCPPINFPSAVTATPSGDCGLLVEWDPASGGEGNLVYDVYRERGGPVPLDPANRVASGLSGTELQDAVAWGADYQYRVVARDQCASPGQQEEPNGGGDSPPTAAVDETEPSFDGVTDTEDAGFCQVLVHWDEATAVDDCSGILGYTIYRDNGVGHAGETLIDTAAATPYTDTTPGNGVWVYVVRAVNGAGLEERNEVFVQESEGSCTNDFPRDAGMRKGKNVDPPNADKQDRVKVGRKGVGGAWVPRQTGEGFIWISWEGSPDEEGLYPVTYSVLRGELLDLSGGRYDYQLVDGSACGIAENEYQMLSQVDGVSYYYVIAPASGDNATFGYDSLGVERPETAVCD